MKTQYTIVIQWSDEDQRFVVSLPEWGDLCHTHSDAYEKAFKNAQEVLEHLIESSLEEAFSLPKPNPFGQSFQVS